MLFVMMFPFVCSSAEGPSEHRPVPIPRLRRGLRVASDASNRHSLERQGQCPECCRVPALRHQVSVVLLSRNRVLLHTSQAPVLTPFLSQRSGVQCSHEIVSCIQLTDQDTSSDSSTVSKLYQSYEIPTFVSTAIIQ